MYLRIFLSLLFLPNFLLASYKYETIVDDGNSEFNAMVVNKPFYDPNKNLTIS